MVLINQKSARYAQIQWVLPGRGLVQFPSFSGYKNNIVIKERGVHSSGKTPKKDGTETEAPGDEIDAQA
ncbi:Protein sym1 [Fusarium oxysporum f. sp. albedinis]|nr:Protein sym1 [Fusarium oxysporum f. sp. albedinis]